MPLAPTGPPDVPQNAVHDEGYLLHTVVWLSPATYAEIYHSYMRYIKTHCGMAAIVGFDGYAGSPSTKSEKQKRRAAKRISADIKTAGHIKATVRRADFLGNPHNKQRLIKAASESLQAAGTDVKQAVSDSDTLIVSPALVHAAEGQPVARTLTL